MTNRRVWLGWAGWQCGLVLGLTLLGCSDKNSGGTTDPIKPAPSATGEFPKGAPPRNTPPENTVGGFVIELPAVKLKPGEEQFPCFVFKLNVEGPSRMVNAASLTVGPGMHHGNITTRPIDPTRTGTSHEGWSECKADESQILDNEGGDIANGGSILFASSTQLVGTEWQSLPVGMGYRLGEGFEVVARLHYVNPTDQELEVAPKYHWYTVPEADVHQELSPFMWSITSFEIAPRATYTATAKCTLPEQMNIVNAMPHMHKLGTNFSAGFIGGPWDGRNFLESKGYDPDKGVITQYIPAVDLTQGQTPGDTSVTFSCTWRNTFDKPIYEGNGDNEMCILFGYSYPKKASYTIRVSDKYHNCLYIAPP